MRTDTASINSCVDLFITIEVFDAETDSDRLISTTYLNSTDLNHPDNVLAYQSDTAINTTISSLPKENTCFMVRITYGQDGKIAGQ
jgi:hypothetical protein